MNIRLKQIAIPAMACCTIGISHAQPKERPNKAPYAEYRPACRFVDVVW